MLRLRFSVFVLLSAVALINGLDKNIPPQPTTQGTSTDKTTTITIKTTTPSPVTNATTIASTTAIPTTKAPPTPGPKFGHYVVRDNSSNACIIAELAAEMWISLDNHSLSLTLPTNMSSEGSYCSIETDYLILTAFALENKNSSEQYNVTLTLIFKKDDSTKHYKIANMSVNALGSMGTTYELLHSVSEFSTPLSKSYHCAKEQTITMNDTVNPLIIAALKLSHVQFEAFHGKNDTTFGTAIDCQSALSPDVVPIAVGCALVGLIAIVMIAYLVGRRRSQARGYLSM